MKKLWLLFTQATTIFLAFFWLFYGQMPFVKETEESDTTRTAFSQQHAIAQALPAVVHISIAEDKPNRKPWWAYYFGKKRPEKKPLGVGSGIILDKNGLIATNFHVIKGAQSIFVELSDGQRFVAELLAFDSESDIAILKIEAQQLPYLKSAPENSLAVGDMVFAIGNPFGMRHSVTLGIISALHRTHYALNPVDDFIQTDNAINPGNSGGALINTQGELIGMTTAIYSENGVNHGIAFSIPIDRLNNVVAQLLQKGKVERGYLGIKMKEIEGRAAQAFHLPHARGVLIAGFAPNSPAATSDLKIGDVLLKINETEITDSKMAIRVLKRILPGDSAVLTIARNLKTMEIPVVLAKRPTDP